MPINAHPEYLHAEREYDLAQTLEERIKCLEKMISYAPSHKGGENLRAELRTRLKKLREKVIKQKKSGKSTQKGIKKQDMQVVITGFPNTGKSTIFKILTNQQTKISPHPFTTYKPCIGTLNYQDVKIQIIDTAPFPNTNQGLINSADTLLIVINHLKQIKKSQEFLGKTKAKIIIIFNKADLLTNEEKRKTSETLKTKKHNSILFSEKTKENLEELKNKIFQSFSIIRIYTKEPKKPASKTPMILKPDSTVEDVAEKILKGFSKKIKKAKIWGPSSKFSGQVVGLNHKLKDKDIIEFQTS